MMQEFQHKTELYKDITVYLEQRRYKGIFVILQG